MPDTTPLEELPPELRSREGRRPRSPPADKMPGRGSWTASGSWSVAPLPIEVSIPLRAVWRRPGRRVRTSSPGGSRPAPGRRRWLSSAPAPLFLGHGRVGGVAIGRSRQVRRPAQGGGLQCHAGGRPAGLDAAPGRRLSGSGRAVGRPAANRNPDRPAACTRAQSQDVGQIGRWARRK